MAPRTGGGDGNLKRSWLERVHLEEQVRKPGKNTDKTSRQNMTMTSEPKFQEHKKL